MDDDPSAFRRYLLGELEESEREALEAKLMTSDEYFEELLISEEEIVDDYHAGTLDANDQQKYRERFLVTPERLELHRFGAALREHVSATEAREAAIVSLPASPLRSSWAVVRRLSLAAAAIALLAAGLWAILRVQHSPVRLEETARSPQSSTVAFFLTAGNLRSLPPATEQTITIPAGVASVDLQLDLPNGAAGDFAVTLEDAQTDALLAEGTLPAGPVEGQMVVVARVPSELLLPGHYRVSLRARSADVEGAVRGTYEFQVMSQ